MRINEETPLLLIVDFYESRRQDEVPKHKKPNFDLKNGT